MQTFEIVGIQPVDYVSKKTNNRVVGTNLFCTFDDDKINGLGTERIYVSDQVRNGQIFKIGDFVSIYYNRYGSVDSVVLV